MKKKFFLSVAAAAACIAAAYKLSVDQTRKNYAHMKKDKDGTETAFMGKKEFENFQKECQAPCKERTETQILSEKCRLNLDKQHVKRNNSVLLVGARPEDQQNMFLANILQMYGSYVVFDPEGKLHEQSHDILEKNGYAVEAINFLNPEASARYNPFEYIQSTTNAKGMADILCSEERNTEQVSFFEKNVAVMLLKTLIMYLVRFQSKPNQTMGTLLTIVKNASDVHNGKTKLDFLFDEVREKFEDEECLKYYDIFASMKPEIQERIVKYLEQQLGIYAEPGVKHITEENSIIFGDLPKRHTAVFIITPRNSNTYSAFTALICQQAIRAVYERNKENPFDTNPIPVTFMLSDADMVQLPLLSLSFTMLNSKRLSAVISVNSLRTLKKRFPSSYDQFFAGCHSQVYYRKAMVESGKEISQLSRGMLSEDMCEIPDFNHVIVSVRGYKPIFDASYVPAETVQHSENELDLSKEQPSDAAPTQEGGETDG